MCAFRRDRLGCLKDVELLIRDLNTRERRKRRRSPRPRWVRYLPTLLACAVSMYRFTSSSNKSLCQ